MKTYLKQKENKLFLTKRVVWDTEKPQETKNQTDINKELDELVRNQLIDEQTKNSLLAIKNSPEANLIQVYIQVIKAKKEKADAIKNNERFKVFTEDHPKQKELFDRNIAPVTIKTGTKEVFLDGLKEATRNHQILEALNTIYSLILEEMPQYPDMRIRTIGKIPKTELEYLTETEVYTILLSEDPIEQADWLKNNKERNARIGKLIGQKIPSNLNDSQAAMRPGKSNKYMWGWLNQQKGKELFILLDAKKFREVDPRTANRYLKKIERNRDLAAEAEDKAAVEAALTKALE